MWIFLCCMSILNIFQTRMCFVVKTRVRCMLQWFWAYAANDASMMLCSGDKLQTLFPLCIYVLIFWWIFVVRDGDFFTTSRVLMHTHIFCCSGPLKGCVDFFLQFNPPWDEMLKWNCNRKNICYGNRWYVIRVGRTRLCIFTDIPQWNGRGNTKSVGWRLVCSLRASLDWRIFMGSYDNFRK